MASTVDSYAERNEAKLTSWSASGCLATASAMSLYTNKIILIDRMLIVNNYLYLVAVFLCDPNKIFAYDYHCEIETISKYCIYTQNHVIITIVTYMYIHEHL